MSPQMLMPPLRPPFTMHLDSDNLIHHEGFLPVMESNILTYWRGDRHKLLTTLLQHSDSVLHPVIIIINWEYVPNRYCSMIFVKKVFSKNYKCMQTLWYYIQ